MCESYIFQKKKFLISHVAFSVECCRGVPLAEVERLKERLTRKVKRPFEDRRVVGPDGPEPAVIYVVETPWVEDVGVRISGSSWENLLVSRMGSPKVVSAPFTKERCLALGLRYMTSLHWNTGSILVDTPAPH